ncbi:MAG TPA: cytochrome D1 domain-containing protein [Albitalea sp.]
MLKTIKFAGACAAAVCAAAFAGEAVQRHAKDGVIMEFSAAPSEGTAGRALMEGELAELRFKIRDEASGQPLTGSVPGAWLDIGQVIQGQPGAETKSCKEKVALYLRGIVGIRPMMDLNSYYVVVLNRDPSISIVDPNVSLANATSTLARIILPRSGADWAKSPDGKRLYVSMPQAGQVAVIDTDTFKLLASVDAGRSPTRVLVQPDGKYLWVGNDARVKDGSGVTVIDTETLRPVKHLATGVGHHEIAVSDDNRVVFVTNRDSGTVSLVDVRKLELTRQVKVGAMPLSVAYSSLAKVAYVADGKDGVVTVLGGSDFAPLKRIALKQGLGPLRFTPDGRHAMVVNTSEDLVHVLDVSGNELVHDIPVKGQPFQLAFTRAFAYVRSLASERVTMINLLSLDRGAKPIVQSFATGSVPPKAAGELPLADSMAAANVDAAVLVVNPADNTTYYYMEGMNAPASNYQSYGAAARAVTVVDRSLKETEPGVYTSKVRIPVAGRYDVALMVNSPRIIECFSMEAKENPTLAVDKQRIVAEFLVASREVPLGAKVPVRVKLSSVDGKPQAGLKDVSLLSYLVPGQRREEALAREVEPGVYEATVLIHERGAYSIHVASKTLKKQYHDLAFLSLRTARPDIEAEIKRRMARAKP